MQAEAIKDGFQINSEITDLFTKNQTKKTERDSIFKPSSDAHKKEKKVLSII